MSRLFPWIGSDKSNQSGRTGKTPERAEDALAEANAAANIGDIKAATRLFEESIRVYHALGLKQDEAAANHSFAAALATASEFTGAFEAFSASIVLYRTLSEKAALALVLRDGGQAYADYSDMEQAAMLLNESLSLYRALDNSAGAAATMQALGRAAYLDGDWNEAERWYTQSRDMCVQLGILDQAALCLGYLSSISVEQDDFDSARDRYFESIDRYRLTLSASSLTDTLAELGSAPFAERSQQQASELLTAAIAIYSHARASVSSETNAAVSRATSGAELYNPDSYGSDSGAGRRAEAAACLILAPVAYRQDRRKVAESLFVLSFKIALELEDSNLLCHSLLQAGSIAERHYDLSDARNYYDTLKETAVSDGLNAYMAPALYASASLARHVLELDSALRDCEACLELYKNAGNLSAVARTLTLYGILKHELGDTETGIKLLRESLTLFRHSGDSASAAGALQCLGAVAMEVDPDYSRACLQECLDSDEVDNWRVSTALQSFAELELLQGEIGSAFEYSSRALMLRKDLGDSPGIAAALELCGHVATIWGDIETAVILLSRSESIQSSLGIPRQAKFQERYEANLDKLKSEMGEDDFEKARSEGTALTLDEISDEVEQMLEDVEPEDELEDEDEFDELEEEV